MKKLTCFIAALVLTLTLTGCGQEAPTAELSLFAMDTYMTLSATGENGEAAVAEVSRLINALEQHMSRTLDTSDVSLLNRQGYGRLDDDTDELLRLAVDYSVETGGSFDPTVAPLVDLWGITSDDPHVPTQAEIDALLPLVGSEHIHWSGDDVTLDEGCSIDLGGIAKGYASDKAAAVLTEAGLSRACANLGGNVYVWSNDGQPWNVGIQDPDDPQGWVCTLALDDHFVVTSGGYQRYFVWDGTVYQHIINPKNGSAVGSDLTSVSIITRYDPDKHEGTRADAYSTALYLKGEDEAIAFWREKGDFDMVLVSPDGRVLYTPGLADRFTEVKDSNYVYQQLTA